MKKIGFEIVASAFCAFLVLVAAIGEAVCSGSQLVSIFGAIKDIAASGVAFAVYFVAIKSLREHSKKNRDKLQFLDEFEENKYEILNSTDISPYYTVIFYGMQSSLYSGDYKELLHKISVSLKTNTLGKECRSVLQCAMYTLSVFTDTNCLKDAVSPDKFDNYTKTLAADNPEWLKLEKNIKDKDLLAWCRIQRADALALVLENHARFVYTNDAALQKKALDTCFSLIKLLNEQLARNPDDKYYALLFRSYINRNIGVLYELQGNAEKENRKAYSEETLKNRKELFEYCKNTGACSDHIKDFVTHEYLLALVEHYFVEENVASKERLKETANEFYNNWTQKIDMQKRIFENVESKMSLIE